MSLDGMSALYIFMLAAFTGYEIIASSRHPPHAAHVGSNFVHGVVGLAPCSPWQCRHGAGANHRLLRRRPGAANAAGGYVVTERMLAMFKSGKRPPAASGGQPPGGGAVSRHEPAALRPGRLVHRCRAFHLRLEGHGIARHGAPGHRLGRRRHGRRCPGDALRPHLKNLGLMAGALALGTALAWVSASASR